MMTEAAKLAGAVRLFHRGGPWTSWDRHVWRELTGQEEATTRVLCDLARRVEEAEEGKE
jgi:hypothetical protein